MKRGRKRLGIGNERKERREETSGKGEGREERGMGGKEMK